MILLAQLRPPQVLHETERRVKACTEDQGSNSLHQGSPSSWSSWEWGRAAASPSLCLLTRGRCLQPVFLGLRKAHPAPVGKSFSQI